MSVVPIREGKPDVDFYSSHSREATITLCQCLLRQRVASRRSYKNLTKAQEKFDQIDGLWQTISKWNEKTDAWMNEPFSTVNAEEVNTEVQTFVKDGFAAHKKARE